MWRARASPTICSPISLNLFYPHVFILPIFCCHPSLRYGEGETPGWSGGHALRTILDQVCPRREEVVTDSTTTIWAKNKHPFASPGSFSKGNTEPWGREQNLFLRWEGPGRVPRGLGHWSRGSQEEVEMLRCQAKRLGTNQHLAWPQTKRLHTHTHTYTQTHAHMKKTARFFFFVVLFLFCNSVACWSVWPWHGTWSVESVYSETAELTVIWMTTDRKDRKSLAYTYCPTCQCHLPLCPSCDTHILPCSTGIVLWLTCVVSICLMPISVCVSFFLIFSQHKGKTTALLLKLGNSHHCDWCLTALF